MTIPARVYSEEVGHVGRGSIDTTQPLLTTGIHLVTVPLWTELLMAKVNVLSVFNDGGDPPVISVGTNSPDYDNIIESVLGDSVNATFVDASDLPMITPDLIGDADAADDAQVEIFMKVTKTGGAWVAPAGWANITLLYAPGRGGGGQP